MSALPRITVMIPTFRLPQGLKIAAESIISQTGIDLTTIELVIIDNAPEAPSRDVAEALKAKAPFPVIWVHEPRPGVANARNAGVAVAKGAFVAFLDDDEEAEPDWLAALMAAEAETKADVIFGAVHTRLPEPAPTPRAYFERFFGRSHDGPDGLIDDYYGVGNALFRTKTALAFSPPFDLEANEFGGEDDTLFRRLQRAGGTFAWASTAKVWEIVPPARARWAYTLRRSFAHGHGVVTDCAERGKWGAVAGWMAKGLAQMLGMGLVTAGLWLIRDPRWGTTLDLTARGAGKMLWFGGFRQKFYGTSRVT